MFIYHGPIRAYLKVVHYQPSSFTDGLKVALDCVLVGLYVIQVLLLFSACTNGTYGRSCENRCHCEDNVRCNALNGACPGNCALGWEGETCSLG